jgi:hypothetical protein
LLIIGFKEGEQVWIKASGWFSTIMDLVKSNLLPMKDGNILQFHKNDTGKFHSAEKYDTLMQLAGSSAKTPNPKSKKSSKHKSSPPLVRGESSSNSSSILPWLAVAKGNISGTSNMRKAEKNVFRGFVREYLDLRFGKPQDYMITEPTTGKMDFGIPSDRVEDFLQWYGEKGNEKHDQYHREMLQKLHKGDKLRALEKTI